MDKYQAHSVRTLLLEAERSLPPEAVRGEYEAIREEVVGINEHTRPRAYPDSEGNCTVGKGFNMDCAGAREDWKAAFAGKKNPPDFDAVKARKRELTQEEIDALYYHSVAEREKEIIGIYGRETWDKLKANERLAIEDMFYNGGHGLVGKNTKFHRNIQSYAATGDLTHLDCALWEVKCNSNRELREGKPGGRGIQNRREAQATLLNTYDRDLETLPVPSYRQAKEAKAKTEKKKDKKRASADTAFDGALAAARDIGKQLQEKLGLTLNDARHDGEAPNTASAPSGKDRYLS